MKNKNKKKVVINSAVGAISLLLVTVLAACAKDNNGNVEVANITEDVNVENAMSDVSNEAQENLISDTEEKEAEKEEASNTEETSDTKGPTENTETSNTEISTAENTETTNKEETANTESNNSEPVTNQTTTTSSSWGTPQEYNGNPEGKGPGRIIVKGFDYNNVWGDMVWKGEYWTASNGVEIKVISVIDYTGGGTGMVPVPDGKGKDNEPNSPFQIAMAEAGGDNIYEYNADMNVTLPLASYKRADIDIDDANIVAYRNAYDYKLYSINGQANLYKPYQYGDPVNMRLAVASDGIAEFDELGAKFWHIRKVNDYWEVRINANLAEFRWDGIHQVLRYLSPDGDSLYQLIYDDCYTGRYDILPEYDEWYSYQNSQVMLEDTEEGYVIYRFK